ncbi:MULTISPECIES: LysR family transcriptional regulator [unclassified Beijerinckia]|uniref:LysR family transcriptional regulator n=1 Tax=unclassified Beijerinckia TaxID=2638183 RepID=UPI00089C3892|nr:MULTISPECIES: LysR family transcriptional regulator [unclassified Beijerinckia]MDH7796235.1 DNA-binding transcriptional LysR family regulator [Beijerinckia sp. GAS462]SEC36276.1 transcriptional regulator, LysR family [Beijerinckia sp. 28-YEA-48]
MKRDDLSDLALFAAVAEQKSFTRAAALLGMSQSALSHAMKALEGRLGLRLLARTTRSVETTEAGERLLCALKPAFDDIAHELTALGELRDRPSGTIRITAGRHAATSCLWPALRRFLPKHPDVQVEVSVDAGLTDIVAGRFDAGIRIGEQIEKDMIAVRVSPPLRSIVVGAPSYFKKHPAPRRPQDLADHDCINYRFATAGSLYVWEFEKSGRPMKVRVNGRLIFNDAEMIIEAVLAGHGLANVFEDQVKSHITAGRLRTVLNEWCSPYPGYYLYYPSRRQTPALKALIEAMRI